ncbi:hypothetical protein ACFQY5_41260 [Paeniroseomonas aquatica]|uniref:NADH-quinone oxidoreductase subunit N n=1 Tax=Paeniroseomonas aquatica TaxID=373043 RepID=A0ABT8AGC6_9PROT|nr:hypothetical protein [Paeniroseomonas aquatica]MDN3568670.1 hypothetical protein [Paeniroseomonas aquatica]
MAALISELIVMVLAVTLMAMVALGPKRHTKLAAVLMSLALMAASLSVAHQWFR